MEKIDQLEKLGNIQKDIANTANLQRFVQPQNLSDDQMLERSHSWFFDNLKKELSSRLAIVEAIFTSECAFHSFSNCVEILKFLNDLNVEVDEFVKYFSFDESGEDEEESEVEDD